MPRLTQLHSFLDRFEQSLEVDCERLKRQLLAQVDQQFGVVRTNVKELRKRFGGNRVLTARSVCLDDDPPVETVQLDLWLQEQGAIESSGRDVPSTSTDRKRKPSNTSQTVNNKRHKTVTTGSNTHLCKSPGCGKSFADNAHLAAHERIHLGTKPFSCTWPDCGHSFNRKSNAIKHVRTQHFKLPALQKDQERLNIVDNRNPEDYVRVDNQLLDRRLE